MLFHNTKLLLAIADMTGQPVMHVGLITPDIYFVHADDDVQQ